MQHSHDVRQILHVVLPENDNHGVPIPPVLYDLLESVFEAVSTGWTCTYCRGGWVDESGEQYRELNRAYEITVSDPRDVTTLRRIAHKFGSVVGQDTVYSRVQPGVVFFDRIPYLPITSNGHVNN